MLSIFMVGLLKNKIAKKVILYSIIPFTLFAILNYILTDKDKFSNAPYIVEFLVFMFILIYYFFEQMKFVRMYPLYQSLSFWLCVGLFIYFTGNFFYLLFITSSGDRELASQMKIVYCFVNIAKDIILSLAWLAHEPTEEENAELHIPDDVHLDDEFNFTNKFINS
jgi:hypothetical protein